MFSGNFCETKKLIQSSPANNVHLLLRDKEKLSVLCSFICAHKRPIRIGRIFSSKASVDLSQQCFFPCNHTGRMYMTWVSMGTAGGRIRMVDERLETGRFKVDNPVRLQKICPRKPGHQREINKIKFRLASQVPFDNGEGQKGVR